LCWSSLNRILISRPIRRHGCSSDLYIHTHIFLVFSFDIKCAQVRAVRISTTVLASVVEKTVYSARRSSFYYFLIICKSTTRRERIVKRFVTIFQLFVSFQDSQRRGVYLHIVVGNTNNKWWAVGSNIWLAIYCLTSLLSSVSLW
jgi:hypothetical protein